MSVSLSRKSPPSAPPACYCITRSRCITFWAEFTGVNVLAIVQIQTAVLCHCCLLKKRLQKYKNLCVRPAGQWRGARSGADGPGKGREGAGALAGPPRLCPPARTGCCRLSPSPAADAGAGANSLTQTAIGPFHVAEWPQPACCAGASKPQHRVWRVFNLFQDTLSAYLQQVKTG